MDKVSAPCQKPHFSEFPHCLCDEGDCVRIEECPLSTGTAPAMHLLYVSFVLLHMAFWGESARVPGHQPRPPRLVSRYTTTFTPRNSSISLGHVPQQECFQPCWSSMRTCSKSISTLHSQSKIEMYDYGKVIGLKGISTVGHQVAPYMAV